MNYKDKLKILIFIDIETIPQKKSFEELTPKLQDLFLKKAKSTISNEEIDPNTLYKMKAGIFAEFGQIICISIGRMITVEKDNILFEITNIANQNEFELLSQFVQYTQAIFEENANAVFAGHNIKEFDIPFIGRRLIINSIKVPSFLQFQNKKPWEVQVFDSLQYWKFGDYKNFVSLDLLATILDIPSSKENIDGSQVQDIYYIEQNLQKIVDYCNQDVWVNFQIILRLLGLNYTPSQLKLKIIG